jgi:hypothetical protein
LLFHITSVLPGIDSSFHCEPTSLPQIRSIEVQKIEQDSTLTTQPRQQSAPLATSKLLNIGLENKMHLVANVLRAKSLAAKNEAAY